MSYTTKGYKKGEMSIKGEVKEVEVPVSKDLEEAANDYAHDLVHDDVFETFIAGAQWQKQQLIDKACNYFFSHSGKVVRFFDNDSVEYIDRSDFIKGFRQAMEE